MSISLDEVRHVAKLARLELSESELMSFQSQLNSLLGHFQDIQHLDVTGLPPKPHAVALQNVLRDDVSRPGLARDASLKNSANTKSGLFIVPTIIEE